MAAERGPRVARLFALAAALLILFTTAAYGSGGVLGLLAFAAWALSPWVAFAFAARWLRSTWLAAPAGVAGLGFEAWVRATVFWFPQASTAAIALVFSPILVALCLAGGALLGLLARRVAQ